MTDHKTIATVSLCISDMQLAYRSGDSSLLNMLELNKIQVEYQCRAGYCGLCRIKLVKGQVVWCQQPLAYMQDNEILACCCQPLGDIEIEI